MSMSRKFHKPQYIVDSHGIKQQVILHIKEYEELLDHLEELEDITEVRKRKNEKTFPYEELRKELGLA